MDGPPFPEKGDLAEGFYAGSGLRLWDDAEYAAYCHVGGALSVLSAAMPGGRPFALYGIVLRSTDLHHKCVSMKEPLFVVFLCVKAGLPAKQKEKRRTSCT